MTDTAAHPLILEAVGLVKRLGAVVIADGIDLRIDEGSIVGMVGPNGVGKTTMLGLLSGDVRPDSGTIMFNGRNVTNLSTSSRIRLGMGRTFQVPRPFAGLTVFEHALLSAQQAGGLYGSAANERAVWAVDACGMMPLINVTGANLRLLDRKRMEVARAIAGSPRLVFLDEVAAGLSVFEVSELTEMILRLRDGGITFLWVEHVLSALLAAADRMVCLGGGHLIADGTPTAVLKDPLVVESYLGSAEFVGVE
jgi:branched-chain amino acid transport system ATP-binding protein